MEFLQLKYFQTVARLEHMTKAAKELNVSQPSLSNSIHRLEAQLGVPLFERQGRQIRLNAFGRTYLRRVDQAFLALEEGKREVADMAGLDKGIVSVAMMLPNVLPDLLKDFLSLHPQVRVIQRQAGSSVKMRSELESADIDFCISTIPIHGPDLEWLTLLEEEMCLTVPKSHRLAARDSIRLIEAADETFVSLSPSYSHREITDNFCREAGFEPRIGFELEEVSAIFTLVEMGLGVTFTMPLSLGNRTSETVQLKISEPLCLRKFGIAWNRKHYLSGAALRFREHVIAYFGKSRP